MLAVIKTGGKQYLVSPGDTIKIEKIEGDAGNAVEFAEVLLLENKGDTKVGVPFLEEMKVTGKIEDQIKGDKIIVFKYKAKKRYRKKQGHRQKYTMVKIEKISTK